MDNIKTFDSNIRFNCQLTNISIYFWYSAVCVHKTMDIQGILDNQEFTLFNIYQHYTFLKKKNNFNYVIDKNV